MRRATLNSWAKFLLLALIILPLCADAKRPAKQEPLDLSILEQRDVLMPYMSAQQRIAYFKIARTLEEAQSELRSGEYLANSKPTALDPDRDLKPLIERGKQMIAQAEATMRDSQAAMVQLLKQVQSQKEQQQAVDLTKYDYTLESATLEAALATHTRELMEACWALGYETLFFDGFFIRDGAGLRHAESGLRNQTYDALVKIDGANFSLTLPADFQLKPGTRGNSRQIFSYENAAIFENDKKALLVFELIDPEGSATGLLSLRAVDLGTQAIAAQRLVKLEDLATVLDLEADGLVDRIPAAVELRDPAQRIDIFANLSQPYTFQLLAGAPEASPVRLAAACLADTLLQNSGLQLVDSAFILSAYGDTLEDPETWVGQASAQLGLAPAEADGSYEVIAQANDSERRVAIGSLSLAYPAATVATAEAK